MQPRERPQAEEQRIDDNGRPHPDQHQEAKDRAGVQDLPAGGRPDEYLPVIAATLRSTAADIELTKEEQLGRLATAVFERIAGTEGDARGVFSTEAAADYAKAVGRDVRVEEIQPVVNELLAANLILRKGHGTYGITDPFVQEIWREKKALERS